MDAGLAGLLGGVIGAAVGALGAAGSAYITGRKSEQQARLHVQAQQAQAQWQLRLEHLNQRREPRAQAYAAVLALANEVLQLAERALDRQEAQDENGFRALAQQIREKEERIEPLYTRVLLEGPEAMVEPTRTMEIAIHHIPGELGAFPDFDDYFGVCEYRNHVTAAVRQFVEAARIALNDGDLDTVPPDSASQ
ncbi:hypothetical protein [Streptomyces chrestomyceticus]|uniref:hypothetical protein n=1 Tax=Streptomyces chrestomyceticus TaxID=68185 RepID=UPI0033E2E563